MEQVALYREWRPQTFREIKGQGHICRTLKNAVVMGRIAHAYLFCGPRGTGKTSTARILAKALNCPEVKEGEPCNSCVSCQGITEGISLNVIEMDGASHRGIEEIRDLKQKVGMAPSGGRYKVYIIDEVHMLTGEAFNALLKTLEEPPTHAVFILATTEAHKVPLTILSRCQRFDFRRLSDPLIQEHLAQVAQAKGWSVEGEALDLVSRQVGGALRDALGLLDQAASFTKGQIRRQDIELLTGAIGKTELEELIQKVAEGDLAGLVEGLDLLFEQGTDPHALLLQLADQIRELLFAPGLEKKKRSFYASFLREIALTEGEMRWGRRPDLLLELTLLRLTGLVDKGSDLPQPGEEIALNRGEVRVPQQVGPSPRKTAPQAEKKIPSQRKTVQKRQAEVKAIPKKKQVAEPAVELDREKVDLGAIHSFLLRSSVKRPLLAGVLPKCTLKRKGDVLVLLAPSFGCDLINRDDNLKILQESLREYGSPLRLEVATGDRIEVESAVDNGASDRLLDKALTLFEGKIIKQNREG